MRRLKSTVSWSVDDEVIPNIIHVFHGFSPIHIKIKSKSHKCIKPILILINKTV